MDFIVIYNTIFYFYITKFFCIDLNVYMYIYIYVYVIIIIMAGMAGFFYVAGYLIEERCRWPVITASPRGQCSITSK